ncbi:MAG: nitroreductase family protein [Candidatus Coatesbacteria bacterium]|nr:MAG: nitroreductase family protein [Candidatus Coatesbacteria bacterium]
MELYEAIANRRSVRRYRPEAVPEEVLARVLEAGRRAPSGHNRQPWRFVVVREESRRRALAEAAASHNGFIAEAPVVLAFLGLLAYENAPAPAARTRGSWTWDMYIRYNVSIAGAYVTLAAAAEGLGTCWINNYDEERVRALLKIPEEYALVCLMPLGYAAEEPKAKPRLPLAELCFDEEVTAGGDG